ncbi:MAG: SMP-30/gluconolactonase/LRE family protein [Spirochaetales bacterium]|nr:MAG: SMP-30/gluconolactonase/LRE family protein [Spirochaetales bacterium]
MNHDQKIRIIHDGICHLGEGPVWNVFLQKLFWTDIFNRRLWMYDSSIKITSLFWEGSFKIGGFAFTKNDDIVACTDRGVYLLRKSCLDNPELLFEIPFRRNEMFNDITVDPAGRIFAGTLDRDGDGGVLYRLEKGKAPAVILENIKCSNGMAFSSDNNYFYHTDSLQFSILRYSYDKKTGDIGKSEIFYKGDEARGMPDGMTIDSEDHIWSAFWGSNTVKRFNPAGDIVKEVRFPAKQVSSVMFGGKALKELFVTSSSQGAVDLKRGYNKEGIFLGGYTYTFAADVTGLEERLADF